MAKAIKKGNFFVGEGGILLKRTVSAKENFENHFSSQFPNKKNLSVYVWKVTSCTGMNEFFKTKRSIK